MACFLFARCMVILLNLIMLLAGLVMIALLLWIRLDNRFEKEIRTDLSITTDQFPLREYKDDIRTGILVSFWVLIGFAIAAVILGFIGLLSACLSAKPLIGFHAVLLLIMILLEIAVGIYVIVTRQRIKNTIQQYLQAAYSSGTLDYDSIRMRYNCCGVLGAQDNSCTFGQPDCTTSVWDRLDTTLMIAGWIVLGIVIAQAVSLLTSILALCSAKRVTVQD